MFGDLLIIGHSTGKIDKKGRLFIPAFTKVEEGENVITKVCYDDEEVYLKVYAYKEYMEILNRYDKLIEKEPENEEKWIAKRESVMKSLNDLHRVDAQHRITLKKDTMEELNWPGDSQVVFDGLGKSLSISLKNNSR